MESPSHLKLDKIKKIVKHSKNAKCLDHKLLPESHPALRAILRQTSEHSVTTNILIQSPYFGHMGPSNGNTNLSRQTLNQNKKTDIFRNAKYKPLYTEVASQT